MKSRKLAITALLIAINVVLSSIIIIPLGPVKAAPVQHFVNVLCGHSRSLVWISSSAYIINFKSSFGTGTAFAFPGSMIEFYWLVCFTYIVNIYSWPRSVKYLELVSSEV